MEADFVGKVADIYKCIVCHLVLKEPIMIVDCGHRLCKRCFQTIQEYANKHGNPLLCPHDRKEVDPSKVVDDRGVARTVLDLPVFCDRKREGCTWSGELRQLEDHVDKQCSVTALKRFMDKVEQRLEEKDNEVKALKAVLSLKEKEIEKIRTDADKRFIAIEQRLKSAEEQKQLDKEDVDVKELKAMISSKDEELEKIEIDADICFIAMDQRLKCVEGNMHKKDEELAILKYELAALKVELLSGSACDPSNSPQLKKRRTKLSEMENRKKLDEIAVDEFADEQHREVQFQEVDELKREIKELDAKISLFEFKVACINKELFLVKSTSIDAGLKNKNKSGCFGSSSLSTKSTDGCAPEVYIAGKSHACGKD